MERRQRDKRERDRITAREERGRERIEESSTPGVSVLEKISMRKCVCSFVYRGREREKKESQKYGEGEIKRKLRYTVCR